MRSKFLLIWALLLTAFDVEAQLSWSSYDTSGNLVSASAATYNSATGTYTVTVPAGTTYTFVTTSFVPLTLAPSQTDSVAFTLNASGGFGPSGTPVQNQRFIAYGLFNYGATPPGASGSFTDDVGLWTDSYQQSSGIAAEVFGGTSATANLLGYASARQLGAAAGPSSGAVGQFVDGVTTNVTFRVVESASGGVSIGTDPSTANAGAWYADTATGGTTFNRTIYSAGAATPSGTTTFNEFGVLFSNSTSSAVTLTLGNFTGLTPIFTAQPPASTVTTVGSGVTIAVAAPTATAFQWQKSTDGGLTFSNVSDATSATLSLSNAQAADAGLYRAVAITASGSYTSANATLTVFTSNPSDPPVFVAFRTSQVSSGTTPASAGTTTINPPGTGWTYSAAAQVTGTTWNQILQPNPRIASGTLNGTTGTFVCNSANNIALTSATGAATGIALTMNMLIADLESGSSTRVEPNTAAGGNTAQGPNGLMDNAWRIYRGGNKSSATLTGLTANAHYLLYVYGSTTASGQGSKFTLSAGNFGSDDVATKSTAGGNSGNVFNLSSGTYSLSAQGTTWQQFHAVANSSGSIVITTSLSSSNGQYYNGLQLVPYPLPAIATQPPANTTGTTNGTVSLSVVATTSAGTLAYQWQKSTDNGVTFNNINPYGGNSTAGTATLTLTNLQMSDAGIYRVLLTNPGSTVISSNATLAVNVGVTPPSITTPPASTTVLVGAQAGFSVVAGGTAPFTYQWQKSTDGGTTFPTNVGTNSDTFTIPSAALDDAGQYRVVVTNSAGSATSNAATLAVNQPSSISTQPVATTIAAGAGYTLSVTASGTPAPTYQWTLNGTNIPGATSSSYSITDANGANAGYYACVVTNAAGTVTSTAVYVGVLSTTLNLDSTVPFAPANGAAGRNRDALLKITFNQPVKVGNAGRIRVYDASAPATPVDTIDMSTAHVINTTSGATVLATGSYMQKTIGGLIFDYQPVIASGNTATIALHSSTALSYGKTYYVNIEPGVLLDASGETFAGISDNTTWTFSTKASGPAAGATSIVVAADGSGDFDTVQGAVDFVPFSPANTIARTIAVKDGTYTEYVHFRSGQNLVTIQGQSESGTVIQYLVNNTVLNDLPMQFTLDPRSVLSGSANDFTLQNLSVKNLTPNGGGQAESLSWGGQRAIINHVRLYSYQDTLLANAGTALFVDSYIEGAVDYMWGGAQAFFLRCELKANSSANYYSQARNSQTGKGFAYVNCTLDAYPGVPASSSYLSRTFNDFSQTIYINCKMGPHINPAGWSIVSGNTGTLQLWEYQSKDLNGAALDVSQRPTFNHAFSVSGNSIVYTSGAASSPDVFDHQQVSAAMAALFNTPGAFFGNWSPTVAPTIDTQPVSQVVNPGASATFSAAATGVPDVTYQWNLNGTPIPGATQASYTIASASGADYGTYTVTVTSLGAPSVTSNPVTLSFSASWQNYVASYGLDPATTGALSADPQADGINNLLKFAFGMNPLSGDRQRIGFSGTTLVSHGLPMLGANALSSNVGRFTRRTSYASDGLIYTPQFSLDLVQWQNSTATPSVVAGDSSYQLVEVPVPAALSNANTVFFRVQVTQAP